MWHDESEGCGAEDGEPDDIFASEAVAEDASSDGADGKGGKVDEEADL